MKLGLVADQPVRAKVDSPWREPWEKSGGKQPRNGAKVFS